MQIYLGKLLVFAVVVLMTLNGCTKPATLVSQDVTGLIWMAEEGPLHTSGFFVHPDGRCLQFGDSSSQGAFWEVTDNKLILKDKASVSAGQVVGRYLPLRTKDELTLVREGSDNKAIYSRFEKGQLLGNIQYFPMLLAGANIEGLAASKQRPYLQFDTAGGVVRGFGGVNNFRGEFRITEGFNIKIGPMMATRMAGPGMDAEIKLFQCLDQADTVLSIEKGLFFYEESRMLCSFSMN